MVSKVSALKGPVIFRSRPPWQRKRGGGGGEEETHSLHGNHEAKREKGMHGVPKTVFQGNISNN